MDSNDVDAFSKLAIPPISHANPTDSRTTNVIQYAAKTINVLRDIAEATNTPYLKAVAGVAGLIMDAVQNVKTNKDQCNRMIERIYELICVIINITAETKADNLGPIMLHNIGNFSETLLKIHRFISGQQSSNLVKRLVKHMENTSLLQECNDGLRHALDVFGIQIDVAAAISIEGSRKNSEERHQELLQIVKNLQVANKLPGHSQQRHPSASNSLFAALLCPSTSSVVPMLPPTPKIFYGREAELSHLVSCFTQSQSADVAILGPGGIGKSSLALALLHHEDIISKFELHRYFIACDSCNTATELVSVVANHFAVEEPRKMSLAIIRHLTSISAPVMMVLDNLETSWETLTARPLVEDFLSLLADIPHLSIVVTMRGAERPGKIRWTRPFLLPLTPITTNAARKIFAAITDDEEDTREVTELLDLTGNVPLAVTLTAHLASFEGSQFVLSRWRKESTAVLSEGTDKRTSLDASISISISSPRMQSTPDAKELLSLLSLLPDGLSDKMLEDIGLPLAHIPKARSTLCRTSLAYMDHESERLKALVPIREYVRSALPPSPKLVVPLRKYLYGLVKLFESFERCPSTELALRISADLGNIRSIIQHSIDDEGSDITDTVYCVVQLSSCARFTDLGSSSVIRSLTPLVERLGDLQLTGRYFLAMSRSRDGDLRGAQLVLQAIHCFELASDTSGQAESYRTLAYFHLKSGDYEKATNLCTLALTLATQAGDVNQQASALLRISLISSHRGNYGQALCQAQKAQALAQVTGNIFVEAYCLKRQIHCYMAMGDLTHAKSTCLDAQTLAKSLGLDMSCNPNIYREVAICNIFREICTLQAEVHIRKTEYSEAKALYTLLAEASRYHSFDGWKSQAYSLANLAIIENAIQDSSESTVIPPTLDSARQLFQSNSHTVGITLCQTIQADYVFNRKQYLEAEHQFAHCLSSLMESKNWRTELTMACFDRLGGITLSRGGTISASRHHTLAFSLACSIGDKGSAYRSLMRLGDVFLEQGDEETAMALYTLTLDGFRIMGVHRASADCSLRIGDMLLLRGSKERAAEYWREARMSFLRSSQHLKICAVDERLVGLV